MFFDVPLSIKGKECPSGKSTVLIGFPGYDITVLCAIKFKLPCHFKGVLWIFFSVQADLNFRAILLPQPSEFWGYRFKAITPGFWIAALSPGTQSKSMSLGEMGLWETYIVGLGEHSLGAHCLSEGQREYPCGQE